MHYIRFLKPPQISSGTLTAKITITTDLGDEFLQADLPLELILHHSVWKDAVIRKPLYNPNIVQWKAGSRELAISIPLPKKKDIPKDIPKENGKCEWQLLVWPCLTGVTVEEEARSVPNRYSKKSKALTPPRLPQYWASNCLLTLEDVLKVSRDTAEEYEGVKGLVLAAESAHFNLLEAEQKLPAMIERDFGLNFWDDEELVLTIEEETGNSIARHVWDAGVVFSALLRELCAFDHVEPASTYLPELHKLLQYAHGPDEGLPGTKNYDPLIEYAKVLNVLELGTGCAIVSATLSHLIPYARIIATDMPEATEIANKNLSRNRTDELCRIYPPAKRHMPPADSSYEVLDWTEPLPETNFINKRKWDLILVADCTYNSDVVPALVSTLRRLVDLSPDVLIAVALKWRHDSEAIFYELMKENGMRQVDKHTERCGNFDVDATGKEEEIEVYLFKGDKAKDGAKKVKEEKAEEKKEAGGKRKFSDGKEESVAKK